MLSEARYELVNALYDQTITFRHKELTAATKAIHAAAAKAKKPEAIKLLDEARALAFGPQVSATQVGEAGLLQTFKASKKDPEAGRKMQALEEQWGNAAKANYARAVELATKAGN